MRSARVLYNVYALLLLFAGEKKKVAINDLILYKNGKIPRNTNIIEHSPQFKNKNYEFYAKYALKNTICKRLN